MPRHRQQQNLNIDLRPERVNALRSAFSAFEETFDKAAQDSAIARSAFIAENYQQGGKPFLERCIRYGTTYRGDPIGPTLELWQKEHLELIGDFRVAVVHTQGPSQLGKTADHFMLLIDSVVQGRLNGAWIFDSVGNMEANQPTQFQPALHHWLKRMEDLDRVTFDRSMDVQTIKTTQIQGANCIFRGAHSATSLSRQQSGKAAVQSGLASFQADFVILEERSQWAPGEADAIPRRVDASVLQPPILRSLGTPGAGNGIEAEIAKCSHHFYPHYDCPRCEGTFPLDPKGCLLKPVEAKDEKGNTIYNYLTETGRPIEWFHWDDAKPQETAYFGCSGCGQPIRKDTRQKASFRCKKTGISLRDFLDQLPIGQPSDRLQIGIQFSPLCRITAHNLAEQIIRDGFESEDATDWQQQSLGHASHKVQGQLTIDLLKEAIERPLPERVPVCRLAGVDQGRGSYWIWISDFVPPANWEKLALEEIIEKSHRVCVYAGEINKTEIPAMLVSKQVEWGLFDNEPERTVASEMQRQTCMRMADQRPSQIDAAKEITVVDGGEHYPCWAIRNDKFLTQTLNSFIARDGERMPLQCLPKEWEKWLVINAEASPVRQLMSPIFDRKKEKWVRPDGNDDLYYACMFSEAAFYLWLLGHGNNSFNRHTLATQSTFRTRDRRVMQPATRRRLSSGRRRLMR